MVLHRRQRLAELERLSGKLPGAAPQKSELFHRLRRGLAHGVKQRELLRVNHAARARERAPERAMDAEERLAGAVLEAHVELAEQRTADALHAPGLLLRLEQGRDVGLGAKVLEPLDRNAAAGGEQALRDGGEVVPVLRVAPGDRLEDLHALRHVQAVDRGEPAEARALGGTHGHGLARGGRHRLHRWSVVRHALERQGGEGRRRAAYFMRDLSSPPTKKQKII